jgi:AcrR family transcriptional regulator
MNDRFFELKKEKQDRFINAALKNFSESGYRRASTDDIVRDAGVSKGLLFHYFESKQGLYEFVYHYSAKYMQMEYSRALPLFETEFFELQRLLEEAKCRVMRTYPYMNTFLNQAFREEDQEIVSLVSERMDRYSASLSGIYLKADVSHMKPGVDPSAVLKLCLFAADGILNDQLRKGNIDPDAYLEEITMYLTMLRQNLNI